MIYNEFLELFETRRRAVAPGCKAIKESDTSYRVDFAGLSLLRFEPNRLTIFMNQAGVGLSKIKCLLPRNLYVGNGSYRDVYRGLLPNTTPYISLTRGVAGSEAFLGNETTFVTDWDLRYEAQPIDGRLVLTRPFTAKLVEFAKNHASALIRGEFTKYECLDGAPTDGAEFLDDIQQGNLNPKVIGYALNNWVARGIWDPRRAELMERVYLHYKENRWMTRKEGGADALIFRTENKLTKSTPQRPRLVQLRPMIAVALMEDLGYFLRK